MSGPGNGGGDVVKCRNCVHVNTERQVGVDSQFFCRRFPPQIIMVETMTLQGKRPVPGAGFPTVHGDAYCGEFRPHPDVSRLREGSGVASG